MEFALDYLIYGTPIVNSQPTEPSDILAISEGWQQSDITALRQQLALEPMPADDARASTSIGITRQGDNYLLVRAQHLEGYPQHPIYQYISLPAEAYIGLAGDLQPIRRLFDQAIAPSPVTNAPAEPLILRSATTWTADKRLAALRTLVDDMLDGDFMRALLLLDAALDGRHLLIHNFPTDLDQRLKLVQGLMMLLPTNAFARLTFATYMTIIPSGSPRIVFSDAIESQETDRRVTDWEMPNGKDIPLRSNYTSYLADLWDDDMLALQEQLRSLDFLAAGLMRNNELDFNESLQIVVYRHQLDQGIQDGTRVSIAALQEALDSAFPPQGKLRQQYLRQMLDYALDERDPEVTEFVAHSMDEDATIDEVLTTAIEEALSGQPDAVYAFARVRLGISLDDRWLDVLHKAAVESLQVAVNQGDPGTLAGWLRLISREPQSYGLNDVLLDGILTAQPRAHEDGELGELLLRLAVRRAPSALDQLLDDALLMNRLPEEVSAALRDQETIAIELLAARTRETFLLSMSKASKSDTGTVSVICVETLWDMLKNGVGKTFPEAYQPVNIIRSSSEHSPANFAPNALEKLLALMLQDNYDDLFLETAITLSERETLYPAIVQGIVQSQIAVEYILLMMGKITSAELMSWQQIADTYTALLNMWNWQTNAMPLLEQLARILQQHPDVTVSARTLWHLLEIAEKTKSETIVRPVVRRMLISLESALEDETQFIDLMLRLYQFTHWSASTQPVIANWWRKMAREQSLVELQKLDRAFNGHKPLEDLQEVVQTAISWRKVIGQRSLEQFAQDVHTAYTVLEAISDAFDPANDKSNIAFDQAMVRAELETHLDKIPAEKRHILATNLKELSQIVASMADHRSKPSLIRSDESLARQLVKGEYQPQSAIDVMKWLSGYLEGIQPKSDDGE